MDIKKELLKQHSKQQCQKIVAYIGRDPVLFKELLSAFLMSDYRLNQRAAWPLSYVAIENPQLIRPHLKKLISNLNKSRLHDAVVRNTFRFLQSMAIPESLQGAALEVCFKFLLDPKSSIAIKVFAMTVAANIATNHPSLQAELKLIIEDQMPYGSAGFVSRGKKILQKLKT